MTVCLYLFGFGLLALGDIMGSYKTLGILVLCGLFLSLTTRCVTPEPVFKPGYVPPKESVTIMTYNVENLFDTEDDDGKKDEAYLPLAKKTEDIRARCRNQNTQEYRRNECLNTDWNESKLNLKLKRLTDVVKKVRSGEGPDILILQEVENKNVLEIWRRNHLAALGYKDPVLIEGPDERGIDIGLMTKLEVVEPTRLHEVKFKANENLKADRISDTRGILEVTVRLKDGQLLTLLGVHLPSQSNPREMRAQALEQINAIKAKLPPDRLVVVGGDFNISSDEEADAGFFRNQLSKQWGVSHLIGCKNCDGTYYYHRNRSWSFFDVLLISPNMMPEGQASWKVDPQSIRIENKSLYQNNRYGNPARFDAHRKDGVSDHWPMVMEIVRTEEPLKVEVQEAKDGTSKIAKEQLEDKTETPIKK